MVSSKFFTAQFPYEDTVTGKWTEMVTDYLHDFITFLSSKNRTKAVNETRGILLNAFDTILKTKQRTEDLMNLQCVVFPRHASIDIRFHQPIKDSLDTFIIESKRGYQIEGLTCESREEPGCFVFRLEIKAYPSPDRFHKPSPENQYGKTRKGNNKSSSQ